MRHTLKRLLPLLILTLSILPFSSNASTSSIGDEYNMKENETREAYLDRLQLKADDIMASLKDLKKEKRVADSRAEKKAIKAEAKALKADLEALDAKAQAVSGGIYIGSGALIVILLLILLL